MSITRRGLLSALGAVAAGKVVQDATIVRPGDLVILTVRREAGEEVEVDMDSIRDCVSKAGIDPDRVAILVGMDAKVVKNW